MPMTRTTGREPRAAADRSTDGAAATVVSQRIADHLRAEILSGALAPGTRITQEDIAQQLKASRLPVREALRILQSQGLVVLKANSGAWVPRMDLRECEASYKIRERLEPLALAESIPNLSIEQIERLEGIQEEIEANGDMDRFLVLDRELHLLSYAGNPIRELNDMVDRLWNTTQPYRRAYVRLMGPNRQWIINAEHRLLIDAVRRADAADAERILTGHIRRTRIALERNPDQFLPAGEASPFDGSTESGGNE